MNHSFTFFNNNDKVSSITAWTIFLSILAADYNLLAAWKFY